jgi:hypothetical protein
LGEGTSTPTKSKPEVYTKAQKGTYRILLYELDHLIQTATTSPIPDAPFSDRAFLLSPVRFQSFLGRLDRTPPFKIGRFRYNSNSLYFKNIILLVHNKVAIFINDFFSL